MIETQRIDKWLWFARVVKSRSLAARLVSEGHVRLNRQRIDTPAKAVRPGDILTIAFERQVRVVRVIAPGSKRLAFADAKLLFEDLSDDRGLAPPRGENAPGAKFLD